MAEESCKLLKRQILDRIHTGDLSEARRLCSRRLAVEPRDEDILYLSAMVASRQSRFDLAQQILEDCLSIKPRFIRARVAYAKVLARRYHFEKAIAEIDNVISQAGMLPPYLLAMAEILSASGNPASACELIEKEIRAMPENFKLTRAHGDALRLAGRPAEAVTAFESSIRYGTITNRHRAYYDLANLKTYKFSDAHVVAMQNDLKRVSLSNSGIVRTSFALARAFENREDWDQSFRYLKQANDVNKKEFSSSIERIRQSAVRLRKVWSKEVISRNSLGGCESTSPIFIVGLPRSGSTLVEQILSSHSSVDGTRELNVIPEFVRNTVNDRTIPSGSKAILTREQAMLVGERYLERVAVFRKGGSFFTDKLPDNYRNIGFISGVLPKAKIIDVRREPTACCFSNYKQLFRRNSASYDLVAMAHKYRSYIDVMDHWDTVLPEFVYRVNYEVLVKDFESEVRNLLDYCGLEFEQQCLQFFRTTRSVYTPSSEQVRLPIYSSSINQWKKFAPHLGELRSELHELDLTNYTQLNEAQNEVF